MEFVIFLEDIKKEFIDKFKDLAISNAMVLMINETNQFISNKYGNEVFKFFDIRMEIIYLMIFLFGIFTIMSFKL